MAFTLKLYNSATDETVQFNDGSTAYVLDYVPREPEKETRQASTITRHGGELTAVAWRNVTETCRVVFMSTDFGTVQALVHKIERFFENAEYRQAEHAIGAVYVYFEAITGSDTTNRSEILSGRCELSEEFLGPEVCNRITLTMIWTRRYYWEDASTTTINITNTNGTNQGTLKIHDNDGAVGATIYNNFVKITAVNTDGDLPAPVRVEIYNSGAVGYNNIFIGVAVERATRLGFSHINDQSLALQGYAYDILGSNPAALGTAGTATLPAGTSDPQYSNGKYAQLKWTGADETLLAGWTLGSALLSDLAGRHYRVMGRFISNESNSGSITLRVKLKTGPAGSSGAADVFVGPQTYLRYGSVASGGLLAEMQEICSVRLPPYLYDSGYSLWPITFQVFATQPTAGTHAIYIDYLYLMPLDGWRHFINTAPGFAPLSGHTFVADEPAGLVYSLDGPVSGTAAAIGNYVALGQPLMLQPGAAQSMFFLWDGASDLAKGNYEGTVRLKYNVRRLTI